MTDEIVADEPVADEPILELVPQASPEVVPELVPTVLEAQAMFVENPGLSAVHTNEGILHRDGVLQRMAIG